MNSLVMRSAWPIAFSLSMFATAPALAQVGDADALPPLGTGWPGAPSQFHIEDKQGALLEGMVQQAYPAINRADQEAHPLGLQLRNKDDMVFRLVARLLTAGFPGPTVGTDQSPIVIKFVSAPDEPVDRASPTICDLTNTGPQLQRYADRSFANVADSEKAVRWTACTTVSLPTTTPQRATPFLVSRRVRIAPTSNVSAVEMTVEVAMDYADATTAMTLAYDLANDLQNGLEPFEPAIERAE